jgi:hypothetical protein
MDGKLEYIKRRTSKEKQDKEGEKDKKKKVVGGNSYEN